MPLREVIFSSNADETSANQYIPRNRIETIIINDQPVVLYRRGTFDTTFKLTTQPDCRWR